MKLTIDDRQLKTFDRQLKATGKVFDKQFLKPALRTALKPVADLARRQAPKRKSNGRISAGRSLSASIRILIVNGDNPNEVKGLVGVSKKKGQAGWRAAPIIRGASNRRTRKGYNRGSIPANDFLGRAEQQGTPLVISSLNDAAQSIVRKALSRYL